MEVDFSTTAAWQNRTRALPHIVRLPAGELDSTFGDAGGAFLIAGTAGAQPGDGASDTASAVAIDAENRVLLAGSSYGARPDGGGQAPTYMTLWRLTP